MNREDLLKMRNDKDRLFILKTLNEKQKNFREEWERLNKMPLILSSDHQSMEVIHLKKGLNDYCELAFSNAIEKGFHDEYRSFGESIALIHSELSEALEADRVGNEENRKEELADVFIRLADLCGSLDIDLEQEVEKKMEKNKNRPRLHGKRY
jgi:NTP pyrophosphatase (non-canonical NTP hydrolase)